ncbi:MAG TPA: GLUG motif-containing protein [Paludibacteraceae bacterium]|nr:GLUG motif-containing protein [Paludibacteraceae bacterium]HOU69719.1 GLUG motif-containing protein [Paludibacteraceae bacterium]HPH64059.1 GLUG motif-containing protein [Paludibacteraceae bacterium]
MKYSIKIALTLFFFLSFASLSKAINGDGSKETPFQIKSLADFLKFRDTVNHGFCNADAVLLTDIDLSIVCYKDTVNETEVQWLPIGDWTAAYRGNFNGDGHVVRNIYVNSDVECFRGVFGLTRNAHIRNLGVENIYIHGGYYTGGLIGQADSCTITNCYTQGYVYGYFTAGMIGESTYSNITNCYSVCTSEGNYHGGLLGYINNENCTISHCYYDPAYTNIGDGRNYGVITAKSTESFKNGAVVELLNEYVTAYGGDSLLFWHQDEGENALPRLGATSDVKNIPNEEDGLTLYLIGDELYLHAPKKGTVTLIDINGKLVCRKHYEKGENHIGTLPKGCYILNGKKIVIQ